MYVVFETIITFFIIAIAITGACLFFLFVRDAFKEGPIQMSIVAIILIGLAYWGFEEARAFQI